MTEDEKRAFGTRLKELREAAGLSQQALAVKAGMNVFGVAKIEQGVNGPNWGTALALARALGVSCEAFNGGAPAKAPASAQDEPAAVKPVEEPTKGKKASKGKPRKRKDG